jgi:hypothetical protein
MSDKKQLKAAVSVTEMARLLNLSRARFYQLVEAGIFPAPVRDAETKRPFYTEELQRACLEVRRRNIGFNGKPVVFNARRRSAGRPKAVVLSKTGRHGDLIAALESLGLASVTEAQVRKALAEAFAAGTAGVDEAEVVRAVFLHTRHTTARDPGR